MLKKLVPFKLLVRTLALWFFLGLCFPASVRAESELLLVLRNSAAIGDLRPVAELVNDLEYDKLNPLSQILLQQYQDRFTKGPSAVDSAADASGFSSHVIAAYQDYWRFSLTYSLPADQADLELQETLQRLLLQAGLKPEVDTDLFRQLEAALAQLGYQASTGFTAPWRDLYIWRKQITRPYQVELTDGVEQVTVTFIEQPLVQGWQHFASLDLVSTTGWAAADGLYCLCGSYDLESPAFLVSWLKHETRHSADLRNFPELSTAQMEYRAKLTELAFAGNEVPTLLRQFAQNGSADGQSAHSLANYRVSQDIYHEVFGQKLPANRDPWQQMGPHQVVPAARKLLERDTALLREK